MNPNELISRSYLKTDIILIESHGIRTLGIDVKIVYYAPREYNRKWAHCVNVADLAQRGWHFHTVRGLPTVLPRRIYSFTVHQVYSTDFTTSAGHTLSRSKGSCVRAMFTVMEFDASRMRYSLYSQAVHAITVLPAAWP